MTAPDWQYYRVATGILLSPDGGSVLLVGNRWPGREELVWSLPGGRAEAGEPLAETLRREFAEETGVQVVPHQLAYVVEARSEVEGKLYLTCAYRVEADPPLLELAQQADVAGVVEVARFVPIAELERVVALVSMREPLRHYLNHPHAPARYWLFPEYRSDTEPTIV